MNLKDMSVEELREYVSSLGLERYRVQQLLFWLYKRPVDSFADMTNLPKGLRGRFEEEHELFSLSVVDELLSSDGTRKLLFRARDGELVESVLIPDGERLTLCISTQVGCRMGCRFCLTGHQGFRRNLSCAEIVDQVILAQKRSERRITNIVVMGMGEPLDNYENTRKALSLITSPEALSFSYRRVTLSTVGITPKLVELLEEGPRVAVSVSLNAPNPEKRAEIMPVEARYPMKGLIDVLRRYSRKGRKPPTVEYVLLAGFNDSPGDAEELAHLLRGVRCKINLIPFNPWDGCPYGRPSDEAVLEFQNRLIARNFSVFIRKSRGADILAACGQLRWRHVGGGEPPPVL